MNTPGVADSVRQRLLTLARAKNWEFNHVLTRYGVERLLCRLAASPHSQRFLLKGAMLFTVWGGAPHRATRDLDLLGLHRRSVAELITIFREVTSIPVEPDGLNFREVSAEPIRATMEAGGIRLRLRADLAAARVAVQVDIGFGDATVPSPTVVEFPTLLDTPKPRLLAYPPETVIAEKLEAMVRLGMGNSRMKDFFDVWHLSRSHSFEARVLGESIRATFAARCTQLPLGSVTALTAEFIEDPSKQKQWKAFLRQAVVEEQTPELEEVIQSLHEFLEPFIGTLRSNPTPPRHWDPWNGWR